MKRITFTLLLVLVGIGLGFSHPSPQHWPVSLQSNQNLGVEITTNSCHGTLYVPVAMTKEKGLVVTVPVKDGGLVSAVRIEPVMEMGKVKFDVFLVSGNYSERISTEALKRLTAVHVSTRVAAKEETLVVRDEVSNAPWSVKIKAVDLRPAPSISKNTRFVKAFAAQDPFNNGEGGLEPCGCAYCNDLMLCPARGKCLNSTCGTVCCPN
ncbi:MAG TPA: hypothetical protein VJU86_13765 [Pyrinomonadaceae bacterium]|nr:hypothetical protein [Pyrinomonadaceae bacterium]